MAAATFTLATIFGAKVVANFDDVTLVASSFTVDTSAATRSVSVTIAVSGQTQSLTASPGINGTMIFTPSLTLRQITFKGSQVVVLPVNASITVQGVAS